MPLIKLNIDMTWTFIDEVSKDVKILKVVPNSQTIEWNNISIIFLKRTVHPWSLLLLHSTARLKVCIGLPSPRHYSIFNFDPN